MTLKELSTLLLVKRNEAAKIFKEAKTGEGYDFSRVGASTVPGLDEKLPADQKAIKVSEHIQSLAKETEDLAKQVESLKESEKIAAQHAEEEAKRLHFAHPDNAGGGDRKVMSYGEMAEFAVKSKVFEQWRKGSRDGRIEIDASWCQAKTLMSTSAGFPPESTRTGTIVDIPLRPLQLVDIMPTGQTGQASVVWVGQTVRTQAAAEVAEGAAKPEAAFAFEERTTPVREVAVFLPVTDTQLEDVPFIQTLIDTQLREDIRERLDSQLLNGNGLTANFEGILNVTGIQTQPRGTDPSIDAIFKAGTLVRTGAERAIPTHVLLHPFNWSFLRLQRDANGAFLLGPPQDVAVQRLFGWPVVENEALPANTGLIGGFSMRNIGLIERRGIVLERGFINDQFQKNQQSIRASMRAALPVFRPGAFATITSLEQ